MRYITLKKEASEALGLLYKNNPDNMVRKRSQCLLLSHQRRTIIDLSKVFDVNLRTIERWSDGLEISGIKSLEMLLGRGDKTCMKGYEDEVAEQVEIHGRNLKNVLTYFKEQHKMSSANKYRRIL
ncbi:MAG: hypothetical protein PHG06_04240 [Parabacteroides sp.]|nr:hypothetical protein [Parabacteroides sp.]